MLLLVLLSFTRLYLCWKVMFLKTIQNGHASFSLPMTSSWNCKNPKDIFRTMIKTVSPSDRPPSLQFVLYFILPSSLVKGPPARNQPKMPNTRFCFNSPDYHTVNTEAADIWQGGKWYKMASGFLEESFRFSFFGLSTCLKVTRSPTQ